MKNQEEIKLNYYQVMSFLLVINDMAEKLDETERKITKSFSSYVVARTKEIVLPSRVPTFILKHQKNYVLSKSRYVYLVTLTGINPLTKETMNEYKDKVKAYDEQIYQEQLGVANSCIKKLLKK